MNNLIGIYNILKDFGERHEMVNEVILVKSEDELDNREFNYRTMVIMPLNANISREDASPAYYIDFGVILIDKTASENDEAHITSIEENMFIVGQLQDYLQQEDHYVEFGDVSLEIERLGDYNITVAMADMTFTLARKPHTRHINF